MDRPPLARRDPRQLQPYRRLTGSLRVLPDFIVIGAQRCGTTSLYHYLTEHPCVLGASRKEVHYFDVRFAEGILWYQGHFPSRWYRSFLQLTQKRNCLTCEASPSYICHPHAPKRIFQTLPTAKLIAILRNPVDRAYSHYRHEVRKGREPLTFEDALDCEEERLRDEKYAETKRWRFFSYRARGIYVDQLRVWMDLFPRNQLLFLRSEDLFHQPKAVLESIWNFLGLSPHEPRVYRKFHSYGGDAMNPATRAHLVEYFRPYNQRLYSYLDRDFGWDQ